MNVGEAVAVGRYRHTVRDFLKNVGQEAVDHVDIGSIGKRAGQENHFTFLQIMQPHIEAGVSFLGCNQFNLVNGNGVFAVGKPGGDVEIQHNQTSFLLIVGVRYAILGKPPNVCCRGAGR